MNLPSLKAKLLRKFNYTLSWKTNRKIVVFESDDWGMIRMASKETYQYFLKKGYPVDECPYSRNDTLESNDDMEKLFEVLSSVKDKEGNGAVITANNIVANPDFDKIKADDFEKYHYESFDKTLQKYPNRDRVSDFYQEGIQQNIFVPQFHGREHLNVLNWLQALQEKKTFALDAFEKNMCSLHHAKGIFTCKGEFLDAFGDASDEAIDFQENAIREGTQLFQKIHQFKATSFIAPCYTWSPRIHDALKKHGIKYLQGGLVQAKPYASKKKGFAKAYHYIGQKNKQEQIFLTRNAVFEPSTDLNIDWVDTCLKEIQNAFSNKVPTIIGVHRLNFMGSINEENQHKNLKSFSTLLKTIILKWPEVEFMSSDQLGNEICKK